MNTKKREQECRNCCKFQAEENFEADVRNQNHHKLYLDMMRLEMHTKFLLGHKFIYV